MRPARVAPGNSTTRAARAVEVQLPALALGGQLRPPLRAGGLPADAGCFPLAPLSPGVRDAAPAQTYVVVAHGRKWLAAA